MCSRFRPVLDPDRLHRFFKVRRDFGLEKLKDDVFPGLPAPFIRRPRERDSGDEAVPEREAVVGLFGLLPYWAKDSKLTKSTYNARSETVAGKPAFKDSWERAR